MPDPDVTHPGDPEYYKPSPYPGPGLHSDYSRRSHEQLIRDVNVAHDFLKKLVAEKDGLHRRLIEQELELGRERRWRKLLIAALGFTWVSFAAVMKYIIPYVVEGIVHGTR